MYGKLFLLGMPSLFLAVYISAAVFESVWQKGKQFGKTASFFYAAFIGAAAVINTMTAYRLGMADIVLTPAMAFAISASVLNSYLYIASLANVFSARWKRPSL